MSNAQQMEPSIGKVGYEWNPTLTIFLFRTTSNINKWKTTEYYKCQFKMTHQLFWLVYLSKLSVVGPLDFLFFLSYNYDLPLNIHFLTLHKLKFYQTFN